MNRVINIVIGFFITGGISLSISAQETEMNAAEAAYSAGEYDQSIEAYDSLLKNFGDSYEVYYNLGNSYYKAGKIAHAILNYERALLIKPGDGDVRFNLELAKQQTTDKIEPLQEFFLKKWFHSVQNRIGVDSWAIVGIISFILFISCLSLYFFSKRIALKKIGFYMGIFMILLVIFANVFAYNQKKELLNRRGAIVFAPTVTVKSSPDNSGTDLFILHEGTKVYVRSSLGDWNEITLEDGNVGWINKKDITII